MEHVTIIAEAGVNHNGSLENAYALIDAAYDAGADYVKFQSFVAEKLVSPKARKADYQIRNMGDGDDSQFNMLKRLELNHENHLKLKAYGEKKGISFFSTAFDVDGVYYLHQLGLSVFKVPSGELTNFPYLRAIARLKKPTILSSGMASLGEIEDALSVLLNFGLTRGQITILHCNTQYPTPMEDVNLKAMLTIANAFGVEVGYSDHTLGIEVPIAAVAMGAKVIEKHFTLDRNMPGPDHKASLEPGELKAMVAAIRNIEKAIGGNGRKEISSSEYDNRAIARKSIHLKIEVKEGEVLSEDKLLPLRPGDGISPMEWEKVIGRRVNKDKNAFDRLNWGDLS
ncbi:N-acetylneuraminate synthase [Parapedobacter sp. 2B3]|uniref:N-acetylneuraminate synthase n=1 Tax=Parapedobacter sp. 2B3 TaxID=3342381 RepID=UPI0035B5DFD4